MPRLSVWFVRSALVYLALGFTFGALMLGEKGVSFYPAVLRLLPAHIEFVLFGWNVQLTMGIAFWILPRFTSRIASGQRPAAVDTRARDAVDVQRRGNEQAAWLAYILLNAGIWLTGMGAVLEWPAAWLLLGRLAEAGAAVAFLIHAWPRVKPAKH